MNNNKKGISPLIATILVIGITVVTAVLITTWLRGTTGGLQCSQECQIYGSSNCQYASADLELSYNEGNAVVINSGSKEFTATVIWLNEAGESLEVDGELSLGAFDSNEDASDDTGGSAAKVKAIVGLYPTLTGTCEGTDCPYVECWESEELVI